MTLDEMLSLLPDNTRGDISAADMRAIVSDLFGRDVALGMREDELNDLIEAAQAKADAALPASQKGAPSGVAALGSDSRLLEANIPERLSVTELTNTMVKAVRSSVGGRRCVFDGDSITAGNNGGVLDVSGNSFPRFATLAADGVIEYGASLAVPGSTIEQMVARFDTTVALAAPDIVHLIAGTNNVSTGASVGTYLAGVDAYRIKVEALGAKLVLGTLPPRVETTARRSLTLAYNAALRAYAAAHGIDLIDYYAVLVDPATGGFLAGLGNADQTHPTNLGNTVMGATFAAHASRLVPLGGVPRPEENSDPNNLITNGMFLGSITSPADPTKLVPQGWSVTTSNHRTGIAASVEEPLPGSKSKRYRLTFNAFTGADYNLAAVSNAKVIPGHTYAMFGGISLEGMRNSDVAAGGAVLTIVAVFNGSDTSGSRYRALSSTAYDIERGFFYEEFVLPAGITTMNVQVQLLSPGGASGVGRVDLDSFGLYDLTDMGLAA